MNRQTLMIAAATIASLAGAAAHGGTTMLGDEAFATSTDETIVWPTEGVVKVRIRLPAELDTGDDGRASLETVTAEGSDDATGIVGTGSIDLVSIAMDTTSSNDFADLLAPGSRGGSVLGYETGVSLASIGGGSEETPSISEIASGRFSSPGTGPTQDGQNLTSAQRAGNSVVSETEPPPAQPVPGSAVTSIVLMGIASSSRRRC